MESGDRTEGGRSESRDVTCGSIICSRVEDHVLGESGTRLLGGRFLFRGKGDFYFAVGGL